MFDRILPILGRVANVILARPLNCRKPFAQGGDNPRRVVYRQGGLRHIGQFIGIAHRQRPDIRHRFHQIHPPALAIVVLAHRPFDFGMTGVTDQDDLAPGSSVAADFHVNLGDQRTGGVKNLEAALRRLLPHRARYAVGAENQGGAVGHFVQMFDKDRAASAQIIHHKAVMHDLVAHVDRCAKQFQRPFDNADGPIHPGAKATGISQMNLYAHAVSSRMRRCGFTHRRWAA